MKVLIYLRRSKHDDNSLSIPAQEADCIRFVKSRWDDAEYTIYTEDGKSGKDITHRPQFQKLIHEVQEGGVDWVVVKKLDRFMRSLQDYLNVSDILKKHGTYLYSIAETLDTSSSYAEMLGIILAYFAQYEREIIAQRVADAYAVRAHSKGFFQGNGGCYGYKPERRVIDGIEGSVLVPTEQAWLVQKVFEIYAQDGTSYMDCIRFLRENIESVVPEEKPNMYANMNASTLSKMLRSPLYVKANVEVYHYLSSCGADLVDDISAYDGVHGLFQHNIYEETIDEDGKTHRLYVGYKGKTAFVKVGYHEGIVDADTWIAVQEKKEAQTITRSRGDAKNSWLVGLTRCPHCGYSMKVVPDTKHPENRYYRDQGINKLRGCKGRKSNKLKPAYVEEVVFEAMKSLLERLKISAQEQSKPSPEVETLKAQAAQLDVKINKLVDSIVEDEGADIKYIRRAISQLDEQKNKLEQRIFKLERKKSVFDMSSLEEPLKHWDTLSVDEKNEVAKTVIDVIYVSDELGIDIKFSII